MKPFVGVEYMVYEDPLTKEHFEGIAVISCVKCELDESLCRCDVQFEDEEICERVIDFSDIM